MEQAFNMFNSMSEEQKKQMFESIQQNPDMMKKAYEQMSGMMGGTENP